MVRKSLLLALLLTSPAFAGWASLAGMPPPQRQGSTLLFKNDQGVLSVSVLAQDIVRVRFAPGTSLDRDHSYAVVGRDLGDSQAAFEVTPERSLVQTAALRVIIQHDPFRIALADASGTILDQDDPEQGVSFAGAAVRVAKRLRPDEHVYGFGEKAGSLDKRGNHLGGYAYAMWNTDAYAWDAGTDPLYSSIPFFLVLRAGTAHGILLDSSWRSHFDVGKESPDRLGFGVEGGELGYYFIGGPSPKHVLERYADLTGRMPLPPRWALGFNQCRWGYYPEAKLRWVADGFRLRRIPADALWLDIDHLDGYKPLTWDRSRFPDPARLLRDLRAQGLRTVVIVDPHPKLEAGYAPYEEGLAGDHFVKRPDGSVFEAPVWPSQAALQPGPSVFPDFSRPATRDWWGGLLKGLLDAGVAGIWNDMNEPATFSAPSWTMPLDLRHDNEGRPSDHREIHNVYGMLMSRATHEGLALLRPDARPFVLTRATFAGGQRYAALWTGDNTADWSHLRLSIPMLLGLGLSGFPFVGADIGGFAGNPTPELMARWLQLGAFYPFMRAHSAWDTPDKEPWAFGTRYEQINRRAIELRYQLLPHTYNVMEEASRTGIPAMRPLLLEFPEDPETWARDDEFLFGADLLVAPALAEGALEREVYLPRGEWYDFWTGRSMAGGAKLRLPLTLESIPIFVRAGAFVFRQPAVQHTGEMPGQPLTVEVYPAEHSQARLYEDDGESLGYQRGAFARRLFEQRRRGGSCTITVGAREGSYQPAPRELRLKVRYDGEPRQVRIDGRLIERVSSPASPGPVAAWWVADGFVTLRLPEPAGRVVASLEP